MAAFGGKRVGDCCRRILKNLFSHELILKFNWIGANGKYSFEKLMVKNIIIGNICLNIHPNTKF